MRIVHLTTSHTGGAGIAAFRLHKMLLENGIQSSFLSKTYNDPENACFKIDDIYPFTARAKTICRNLMERVTPFSGSNSKISATLLKGKPPGLEYFSFPNSNLFVEECDIIKNADIIHLHWIADDFINYRSFFQSINNKSIVWTLHDMNPFTGGCHHADNCNKYITACSECPQLSSVNGRVEALKVQELKSHLYQQLPTEKVRIVTPSKWLMELSKQSKCFKKFQHHQIANPVDSTSFKSISKELARASLNLPKDKKIVLFVAHNVNNTRKGIQLLVDAISELNNPGIILVAAGAPVQSAQWINLGYITDEKMMLAYNAADVFVLPSQAENYPNTIIESLLCGTPVVASKTGGIPEQITDNGILFTPGDLPSLINAITSVLEKSSEAIKRSIRNSALHTFNEETSIDQYIHLYKEISG